ncbi:hypothetical protein JKF63_03699 [Porcisia hertigi]|uniref:Uncharacterized protein n=1 Tax=Porcisia hertigi TaxID=2761500 RepID=A0A836LGX5_9TRYP|nr:hypothetical protein JKF63_03699 [Porcisia hertigi]
MARSYRFLCYAILTSVSLLLFLVYGGAPAASLSGSAECPPTVEDTTAWCSKWFGGAGGVVTAGPWSKHSFTCVCNGVVELRIDGDLVADDHSEPPSLHDGSQGSSGLMPSSLVTPPSLDRKSQESYSSVSSARPPVTPLSVQGGNMCFWNGSFTSYPDGVKCFASTGVCPTSCLQIPKFLCESEQASSCTVSRDGALLYSCATCRGEIYTINTSSPITCFRRYTSPLCNPQLTCNGHGCCSTHPTINPAADEVCNCFANSSHGYYAGADCGECAPNYYKNSAGLCKTRVQTVQILLASIGTTWTMVSPNIAVLFLFVVFGMVRKLNASDRPFELTGMRRANLSTVQVARRRQQSLFHPKYIPMRPAKSRSFANPRQPRTRGPPAY